MSNHYETFINIIEATRKEAPAEYARFHPDEDNPQALVTARSLALTHMFLKAKFGLTTFSERDPYVTDGPNDGGIDAFFIDTENHKIYVVQTKFRASERNFFESGIRPDELLAMDIKRIIDGETRAANGSEYNGRVRTLIREIQKIKDIGRYDYSVIIIANTRFTKEQLERLTGGFPVEVFDSEKVLDDLVFPLVTGNHFAGKDLYLKISLDNAQQGAARINYNVQTRLGPCTITMVYIPTLEIAKALGKFKNAILKFNPRSYLELRQNPVNRRIRETIENYETDEFALFNNGITILASDARYNEHTGRRGEAQLVLLDPQIINGGQTAFTLSRVYDSMQNEEQRLKVFGNKEVLLKVITIDKELQANRDAWLQLVETLSRATNEQTAVTDADRAANDKKQIELQKRIFSAYGYFYERKRGEFADGLQDKYIDPSNIIDREKLARVIAACEGDASEARRASESRLFRSDLLSNALNNLDSVEKWFKTYLALSLLREIGREHKTKEDPWCINLFGSALRYGRFAVIAALAILDSKKQLPDPEAPEFKELIAGLLRQWPEFEKTIHEFPANVQYFTRVKDPITGEERIENDWDGYYKGVTINENIRDFFGR